MAQAACPRRSMPLCPWTARQASAMAPETWHDLYESSGSIAVHPKSSLQALILLHKGMCLPKCPCCGNCGCRISYPSMGLALAETVLFQNQVIKL